MNKLNLKSHDQVKFHSVGLMDGKTGSIIGVAIRDVIDHYIVKLDVPYITDGFLHEAVSIPETCLKRI